MMHVKGSGPLEQSDEKAKELWIIASDERHVGSPSHQQAAASLDKLEYDMEAAKFKERNAVKCSFCGKHDPVENVPPWERQFVQGPMALQVCACRDAMYCNDECKERDWETHQAQHRACLIERDLSIVDDVEDLSDSNVPVDKVDADCPICLEKLPFNEDEFGRMVCCGKGMHDHCREKIQSSAMRFKQKYSCPLCRTREWLVLARRCTSSLFAVSACRVFSVFSGVRRAHPVFHLTFFLFSFSFFLQLFRTPEKKYFRTYASGSRRENHGQCRCWVDFTFKGKV
jgi:hypothetical protein